MSRLNYKTYADLLRDIKQNIRKLPPDIDLVVGLPRSGMIPAYMIGLVLNTQVCSLDEFINQTNISHGGRPVKEAAPVTILVVDDSCGSGNAMRTAKNAILSSADLPGRRILYAAVYVTPDAVSPALRDKRCLEIGPGSGNGRPLSD